MGKKSSGTGWDDVEVFQGPPAFYASYDRYKLVENEWITYRLLGLVYRLKIHWIPALKKASGKETAYPLLCRSQPNGEQ